MNEIERPLSEERDSGHDARKRRDRGDAERRRAVAARGRTGGRRASGSTGAGRGTRAARLVGAGSGGRGTRRGRGARRTAAGSTGRDGEVGEESRRGHLDTVRGRGDLGVVRHRADNTERLSGLGVGHDLAVRSVDARGVLVVAIAVLEGAVLGSGGAVVRDTDTVVDVLAEVSRVGAGGIADLEAEGVATHEAASRYQ